MLNYKVKVLIGEQTYFSYPAEGAPIPRKGEIIRYFINGQSIMKKVLNVRYDITEKTFEITILCEV